MQQRHAMGFGPTKSQGMFMLFKPFTQRATSDALHGRKARANFVEVAIQCQTVGNRLCAPVMSVKSSKCLSYRNAIVQVRCNCLVVGVSCSQILKQEVITNSGIVLRIEALHQWRIHHANIISGIVINFRATKGIPEADLQSKRPRRTVVQICFDRQLTGPIAVASSDSDRVNALLQDAANP